MGLKELRINISMRCRPDGKGDWGHAWLTYKGKPVLERNNRMITKNKTMMADDGKYIYWIYD